MTRPPAPDSSRDDASAANRPAFRGCAVAVLLLGCPQWLDDSFGPADAPGGALANAGSGGSLTAGFGGASGANGGGSASGASGADGTGATGGASAASGAGGASGGAGGAAGPAGNGGSGGTAVATGCRFGDFSAPELIAGLGRSDALYGPSLAGNGLVLAFSESIEEGPEDIYLSQRSAPAGAFGTALEATGVNSADAEGTAFLGADALTLYFFSDRGGGAGGRDIYRATRSDTLSDFADIIAVEGINGGDDDHMPWLSPDERTLYFASNRSADNGGTNLWFARRSGAQDGFEPPIEVPGVNSADRDISPTLSADLRLLFFCSDRDGGAGSDDVWMATREDVERDFGPPVPVPIINGTSSELNVALSADGREVIFSSNRDGGRKLFRSVRSCLEPRPPPPPPPGPTPPGPTPPGP